MAGFEGYLSDRLCSWQSLFLLAAVGAAMAAVVELQSLTASPAK
jgi:hypothetical protein